jgi:tetratricopeptide (TPR) repeat protein
MSITGRMWRLAVPALLLLTLPAGLRAQQPDDDSSPYHQALLNYKAGHYDAARIVIDEAEKQQPNDVATAILKARIMTEQGDFAPGAELLRRFLTDTGPIEVQLALGDLFLRQRNFGGAANLYDQALQLKPGDPDIMLKLIYAKINTADLITAGKYASELKPMDPLNPAYYFADAALSNATGKSAKADEDIQTVRTIYGITVANRYLKTYLEVFSAKPKEGISARAEPPSTNAAPAAAAPAAQP